MARKFQEGDIVEVVKQIGKVGAGAGFKKGIKGKVVEYRYYAYYPYYVARIRDKGRRTWFKPGELKLVRGAKKK